MYISHYESPIGWMTMASDGERLTGLWFDQQNYFGSTLNGTCVSRDDLQIFQTTKEWLNIYFTGKCPPFTPPLHMTGSEFRKEVWEILQSIPFGQTMSYGEIAKLMAHRKGMKTMSAQAVGGAVGHNPISLIIPCHRVIGTNGQLTGYDGGLDKKQWLLLNERVPTFKHL